MRIAILIATTCLLMPVRTFGQAGLEFEITGCARHSEYFNGDVPLVVGSVTNQSSDVWTVRRIGASAKMSSGFDLRAEVLISSIGTTLPPGATLAFEVSVFPPPGPGVKVDSCSAFVAEGSRIYLSTQLTTDPILERVPVAKDIPCFRDYVQSLALEGLALRKRMTELVTYQCLVLVRRGYLADLRGRSTVTVGGKMHPAALVDLIYPLKDLPSGEPMGVTGYVLTNQIKKAPVRLNQVIESTRVPGATPQ